MNYLSIIGIFCEVVIKNIKTIAIQVIYYSRVGSYIENVALSIKLKV